MLPPNPLEFLLSQPLPKHKHPHPRPDSDLCTSKSQNPVIVATDSCCTIYWPAIQRGQALPPTSSNAEHRFSLASNWRYKKKASPCCPWSSVAGIPPPRLGSNSGTCLGLLQPVSQLTLAMMLWQSSTSHLSFERRCNVQSWQGQGVKNLSALQFILERAHTKCSSAGFTHLLIWADVRISGDLVENSHLERFRGLYQNQHSSKEQFSLSDCKILLASKKSFCK